MGNDQFVLPFQAYDGKKPYIFASYDPRDWMKVFPDLLSLYSLGFRIWYDENQGQNHQWSADVIRAVGRASFIIVFVSSHVAQNMDIHSEIRMAYNRRIPFLVALLDDTVIPGTIGDILYQQRLVRRFEISRDAFAEEAFAIIPRKLKDSMIVPPNTTEEHYDTIFTRAMGSSVSAQSVPHWAAAPGGPSPAAPAAGMGSGGMGAGGSMAAGGMAAVGNMAAVAGMAGAAQAAGQAAAQAMRGAQAWNDADAFNTAPSEYEAYAQSQRMQPAQQPAHNLRPAEQRFDPNQAYRQPAMQAQQQQQAQMYMQNQMPGQPGMYPQQGQPMPGQAQMMQQPPYQPSPMQPGYAPVPQNDGWYMSQPSPMQQTPGAYPYAQGYGVNPAQPYNPYYGKTPDAGYGYNPYMTPSYGIMDPTGRAGNPYWSGIANKMPWGGAMGLGAYSPYSNAAAAPFEDVFQRFVNNAYGALNANMNPYMPGSYPGAYGAGAMGMPMGAYGAAPYSAGMNQMPPVPQPLRYDMQSPYGAPGAIPYGMQAMAGQPSPLGYAQPSPYGMPQPGYVPQPSPYEVVRGPQPMPAPGYAPQQPTPAPQAQPEYTPPPAQAFTPPAQTPMTPPMAAEQTPPPAQQPPAQQPPPAQTSYPNANAQPMSEARDNAWPASQAPHTNTPYAFEAPNTGKAFEDDTTYAPSGFEADPGSQGFPKYPRTANASDAWDRTASMRDAGGFEPVPATGQSQGFRADRTGTFAMPSAFEPMEGTADRSFSSSRDFAGYEDNFRGPKTVFPPQLASPGSGDRTVQADEPFSPYGATEQNAGFGLAGFSESDTSRSTFQGGRQASYLEPYRGASNYEYSPAGETGYGKQQPEAQPFDMGAREPFSFTQTPPPRDDVGRGADQGSSISVDLVGHPQRSWISSLILACLLILSIFQFANAALTSQSVPVPLLATYAIGGVLVLLSLRFPYEHLKQLPSLWAVVSLAFLSLPFLFLDNDPTLQDARVIRIGAQAIPTGIMAVSFFCLYVASALSSQKKPSIWTYFLVNLLFCALVLGLSFQPRMSVGLILIVAFGIFYLAIGKLKYMWPGLLGGLVVIAAYFFFRFGGQNGVKYVTDMVTLQDPEGASYRIFQSISTMAEGGLLGTFGQGGNIPLPGALTGFSLATIGKNFGLWGMTLVIAVQTTIQLFMVRVSQDDESCSGYLAGILGCIFCVMSLLGMGCVMGLLPSMGEGLPLLTSDSELVLFGFFTCGVSMYAAKHNPELAESQGQLFRRTSIWRKLLMAAFLIFSVVILVQMFINVLA